MARPASRGCEAAREARRRDLPNCPVDQVSHILRLAVILDNDHLGCQLRTLHGNDLW